MIPTAVCLSRGRTGIFRRSAEEISRLTKLAWNMEALQVPHKPRYLLDFENPETVATCKTMADRAVGGFSTASLDHVPADAATNTPPHARFHGSISTKLPTNWKIHRTGYAAFRNQDRSWVFGKLLWDMDPYAYLALRVKSDGRRYTVNIQTDSIVDTDIHQHRLFTQHHRVPRPLASSSSPSQDPLSDDIPAGLADFPPPNSPILSHTTTPNPDPSGWETIIIRWQDFVRTNLGEAIEPQTSLLQSRVRSVGIGLTDRVEGPYDLRIHRVWATNGLTEEEMEEERRLCGNNALAESGGEHKLKEDTTFVETEGEGLERLKGIKGLKKK
ncbi:hypothetical protein AJ80_01633 [Polytolypa hystricis UAMH7299]|uniref:NADH:ubiquinone oxidoreductase intermediate-associated protein 30 domain-containing protein n=1 Tax=Polytolypa hystricis (strain UAMH7299) TaxID=1447883 RepID=A0A2B7Z1I0_POLH7|nr:hypothetical protein AJ80_01633 [Polytolypa hystricis UAMH7299]